MTYEQALEIAMEELYDAVIDLRYNNKGYESRIEKMCNRLLTARNALHKGLEEMQAKREWVGLENKDRFWVIDEWQQLTRSVKDTEFNKAIRLCKMLEAKIKEKNTP